MEENKKKIIGDAQVKSLINTIFERCKKESIIKVLQVPIEECEERVSFYTALPKTYIQQALQLENVDKNRSKFDVFERIVILNALHAYYLEKKLPKIRELHEKVKSDIDTPDITDFVQEISNLGFSFKLTNIGSLLIEDPKYSFERYHYLKKIKKYRESKSHICYLDEVLIDNHFNFLKGTDKFDMHDHQYVIYHVISKFGLEHYLISNVYNQIIFKKWLCDIMLHLFTPECVIVINSNRLHGKKDEHSITRYHSKSDMIQWLKNNDIPCTKAMHRAELYDLVNKYKRQNNDYPLDQILKAHGHHVLRLPYKCNNLSPVEFFWKAVGADLKEKEIDFELNFKTELIYSVNSVHEKKWSSYEDTVINWENGLTKLDSMIESVLDNYELDKENEKYDFSTLKHLQILEKFT